MREACDDMTVEKRLQSNKRGVQRAHGYMDRSFAKKWAKIVIFKLPCFVDYKILIFLFFPSLSLFLLWNSGRKPRLLSFYCFILFLFS